MKRLLSFVLILCVILSSFAITSFAATEIVIDTDSPYFSSYGDNNAKWSKSENSAVLGANGNYSWFSGGAVNPTAIYDASHLNPGTYGVYFCVIPYSTVAEYMDVIVEISGVGKVYRVDGYHGGKNGKANYVYLGRHTIKAGDTFKIVQKQTEGYTKQLRTAGVKFVLNDTNTDFDYHSTETIITTASSFYSEGSSNSATNWDETVNTTIRGPLNDGGRYTKNSSDYAAYSASGLEGGNYGVYFYTNPYNSAASKVDIRVSASGTQTTLTTDGYHGGLKNSGWIYLGNYDFAGGNSNENVIQQINPTGTEGTMRAFAVKFIKNDTNGAALPYPKTETVITTNGAADYFTKSGTWSSSDTEGPIGGKTITTASKSAVATFKADRFNAKYGVYVYVNPISSLGASYADAKITASGTTTTVKIDAKNCERGADWVYIGSYDFNKNSNDKVTMSKNSSESSLTSLNVSAVKFVLNDDNTSRPGNIPIAKKITLEKGNPVVLDTNDPGFQIYKKWTDSSITLTGAPCYVTGANNYYAIWKIDVGAQKGVNVYIPKLSANTSGNEATATDYEVKAGNTSTTKTIDYRTEGVGWYKLGTFDFTGGGEEYIKITSKGKGNSRVIGIKLSLDNEISAEDAKSILEGNEELHIFERMGMYLVDPVNETYMNRKVTRADMAVMLTRLFGKRDDVISEITSAVLANNNFNDTVGHASERTIVWTKLHPEFGIKRQGANSFSPSKPATKTELIKFILQQLGYYEDIDYKSNKAKSFAESLGIKTSGANELSPTTMAQILYSAFDVKIKGNKNYTFFEKLVRENSGIQDDTLLDRKPLSSSMKAKREQAKNKDRDVIYNNDGNDVYHGYPEYPDIYPVTDTDRSKISTSEFLRPRTTGIYDSKVNTVYYCTGVNNSYTHISQEISEEKGIDVRKRDWSYLLKEYTGKDTLETMIDYCEKGDIDVFWSMRMNDIHDHAYGEEYLDSWKRANLDKLFARKNEALFMQYGSRYWSLIDYTYQEARQQMYDIIQDVVSRYDVDGIELDFSRWPLYFREVSQGYTAYPENVERMNEFIRMIRTLTEKYSMERGKPILVSIYVPDSLDFCYDQGLDIRKWIEEDLIDIAAIGCHCGYFKTWEESIGEYEGKIPVYAALDPLAYADTTVDSYYIDRHEANLAYKAGAKGVYMYNCFNINHERYDTMYDVNSCGVIDQNYTSLRKIYSGIYSVDSDKYVTIGE